MVPVLELEFGMYVAELDRPWTETPFQFQGFFLQTREQLETLKKFCKTVLVDLDRRETVERLPKPPAGGASSALDLSRTGKKKYAEVAPVEHEYARAKATHAAGMAVVNEAFAALRAGKTLEANRVNEAVNGITESVMRNADALLLFAQLQSKGDYTQSHALDVSVYMTAFGRFLEMSADDIRLLGTLACCRTWARFGCPTG